MSRPVRISEGKILEAARAVFLDLGFAGTTAEVARRAGVAEGSIFKRFATKVELFRAAMQPEMDEPDWVRTLLNSEEGGDPREVLLQCGLQAVEFLRRLIPLIMMQWSSGKQFGLPEHLQGPQGPPMRALKAWSAFFDREMRAGRMRKHEPEVVARMMFGSIQSYVFFEIMLRSPERMTLPVEVYLRGLIDVLWSGVAPPAKRGHRT
ncbi:MAG TPA: helix-turn-helix domain-containing protein [Polyangia bacterium]|nr:helix-turn-helix domain-containing protein [Polyangia bacterium]